MSYSINDNNVSQYMPEISFVMPLYNDEQHIQGALEAIIAQSIQIEFEIIVVNDGSIDNSGTIASNMEKKHKNIRIITQENKGAAEATNRAIIASRGKFICAIDSDSIIEKDWLKKIIKEFDNPQVGAVAGFIRTKNRNNFWAKVGGFDLENRYDHITKKLVTHVSTCNTAYRRSALDKVGLFDPKYKYGYDNDMSYRLTQHGYKLVLVKNAICDHYWKESYKDYLRQQFNAAYGRMQLTAKFKEKRKGDDVSNLRMIAQVPLTLILLMCIILSIILYFMIQAPVIIFMIPILILLVSILERFEEGFKIARKTRDNNCLLFPFIHLTRNFIWCIALIKWLSHKPLNLIYFKKNFPRKKGDVNESLFYNSSFK